MNLFKKLGIGIAFLLLLVACKTTSDNYLPYYVDVYKGDSLMMHSEFKKSYKIFHSLFNKYKPINSNSYQEYFTYTKLAFILKEKYKTKLINCISKHGLNMDYINNDSVLKMSFERAEISNKEYESYRKLYINSIDLNLRERIKLLLVMDQKNRQGKITEEKRKEGIKQDVKNQELLINLFDKDIYPNNRVIGNYSIDKKNTSIVVPLLHTNDSMRINYYLPKIKEFIKKGKCPPFIYAVMLDQFHLYNGNKQFYGSYNIARILVEDYPKYNRRRAKIGLPSLEFETHRLNKLKSKM